MADLFGNAAKAAPDALSREIEARKVPPARNPKERMAHNPQLRVLVDPTPLDNKVFRARAAHDAGFLTRKSARAMGLLTGLRECYGEPDRMRKGFAHWALEGRITTSNLKK